MKKSTFLIAGASAAFGFAAGLLVHRGDPTEMGSGQPSLSPGMGGHHLAPQPAWRDKEPLNDASESEGPVPEFAAIKADDDVKGGLFVPLEYLKDLYLSEFSGDLRVPKEYQRVLHLSPEQTAKLNGILDNTVEKMKVIESASFNVESVTDDKVVVSIPRLQDHDRIGRELRQEVIGAIGKTKGDLFLHYARTTLHIALGNMGEFARRVEITREAGGVYAVKQSVIARNTPQKGEAISATAETTFTNQLPPRISHLFEMASKAK